MFSKALPQVPIFWAIKRILCMHVQGAQSSYVGGAVLRGTLPAFSGCVVFFLRSHTEEVIIGLVWLLVATKKISSMILVWVFSACTHAAYLISAYVDALRACVRACTMRASSISRARMHDS